MWEEPVSVVGIKTLNYGFVANLFIKFYLRFRYKKIRTGFEKLKK